MPEYHQEKGNPMTAEQDRDIQLRERNAKAYSDFRYRRYLDSLKRHSPELDFAELRDGRDDGLRDRGAVLEWKRRVLRREREHADRRFWKRVAQAREEAQRRWNGSNVTDIREARR